MLKSDMSLDESLTWVEERVKLEEADNREFCPNSQPQENPEDGHALAATQPCPPSSPACTASQGRGPCGEAHHLCQQRIPVGANPPQSVMTLAEVR